MIGPYYGHHLGWITCTSGVCRALPLHMQEVSKSSRSCLRCDLLNLRLALRNTFTMSFETKLWFVNVKQVVDTQNLHTTNSIVVRFH